MGVDYSAAPEVLLVVRELIASHHRTLADAPMVCLFRDPAAKKNGKETWATLGVVTGRNAYLARRVFDSEGTAHEEGAFFVLEVATDVWKKLSEAGRKALVDHELCHAVWDPAEQKAGTRGHDLEEFISVVRRHGLWRISLFDLVQAGAEQLALDLERLTEDGGL